MFNKCLCACADNEEHVRWLLNLGDCNQFSYNYFVLREELRNSIND